MTSFAILLGVGVTPAELVTRAMQRGLIHRPKLVEQLPARSEKCNSSNRKTCACGAVGTRQIGSEWACQECIEMVARVHRDLDRRIRERRRLEAEQLERELCLG